MGAKNIFIGVLVFVGIAMAGRPLTDGYADQGLGILVVIFAFSVMGAVVAHLDERDQEQGVDRSG